MLPKTKTWCQSANQKIAMSLHHKRTIVTPKCSNFNMQLQFKCISEHHGFKFDNNEKPSNNRYVVV